MADHISQNRVPKDPMFFSTNYQLPSAICNPVSPIYGNFAGIYDRQQRYLRFSAKMAPAIIRALKDRGVQPRSVIDLACGVGVAAEFFAGLGLRVTGVDRSEEMLTLARKRGNHPDIEWCRSDIRDFVGTEPADLVTCMYDSLNYLSGIDEIRRVFANVSGTLRPGGWFAFDVATAYALSEKWVGSETMVDNDIVEKHQASYDVRRKINTKVITVFERIGEEFNRFQEIHIEHFFETKEIEAALGDAGFSIRGRFNGYHLREPNGRSVRILFLAERESPPRQGIPNSFGNS